MRVIKRGQRVSRPLISTETSVAFMLIFSKLCRGMLRFIIIRCKFMLMENLILYQREVVTKMRVSPSKDKVSPGVMELALKLPCGIMSAALTLDFDKGFLHIDEYPPDANQGFDIPSAVVSFPDFQASLNFLEDASSNKSPLLVKMQERSPVFLYTEVLLVPLTTPDFSIPYNFITITHTVFALKFGSLLNVLRRRVGEEKRLLKSKAAKKKEQFPVLLSKLYAKFRGRPWEPPQSSTSTSSSSSSLSLLSSKLSFKVALVAAVAASWQDYSG